MLVTMKHYDFANHFRVIYDKALSRYSQGIREAGKLFSPDETAWLSANGITAQNLFDYAEDFHNSDGEPGFGNALEIETVRRDYFLNQQGGRPSPIVLDADSLPPKDAAVKGIEWLPRIIPKSRAKLRGELPSSLMYCCGGDRRFLKQNDILPAEFLSVVWRNENDDAAIIAWVVRRSSGK